MKLCDFGLSTIKSDVYKEEDINNEGKKGEGAGRTPGYLCPEEALYTPIRVRRREG